MLKAGNKSKNASRSVTIKRIRIRVKSSAEIRKMLNLRRPSAYKIHGHLAAARVP